MNFWTHKPRQTKSEAEEIVDEQYKKIEKEVGKEGMAKLQVRAFFESIIVESPTVLTMQKEIERLKKKLNPSSGTDTHNP